MKNKIILKVENLKKYFPIKKGLFSKATNFVHAIDGLSFEVKKGGIFGLVGESGCGKSTLARCLIRLIEPDTGKIIYNNKDILSYDSSQLRILRRNMQIIFQDPFASLNPRMNIGNIVSEGLKIHNIGTKSERFDIVADILKKVGLSPSIINHYPHEFSGGQRQRIVIARALALKPELLICDEPVSALDVSIQAQVLNLLKDLQTEFNLTYIFISHDLSVIEYLSDIIGVMYLGKFVEISEASKFYANPYHPYSRLLLDCIPDIHNVKKVKKIDLKGEIPDSINRPAGCKFHPRCKYAGPECKVSEPSLINIGKNHFVACHLYSERNGYYENNNCNS